MTEWGPVGMPQEYMVYFSVFLSYDGKKTFAVLVSLEQTTSCNVPYSKRSDASYVNSLENVSQGWRGAVHKEETTSSY